MPDCFSSSCKWNRQNKCGPLRAIGLKCPCSLQDLQDLQKEKPVSFAHAVNTMFPNDELSMAVRINTQCPHTGLFINAPCFVTTCKWNCTHKASNNCLLALLDGKSRITAQDIAEITHKPAQEIEAVLNGLYPDAGSRKRARKKTVRKSQLIFPKVDWKQKYTDQHRQVALYIAYLVKDAK